MSIAEAITPWAKRLRYHLVPLEEATHLIIGIGESFEGKSAIGLLATASNEFQAHQIAREIRKNQPSLILIKENSSEEIANIKVSLDMIGV